MVVKLVGKGNANILLQIDESGSLYRCCIKYSNSVNLCNQYTKKNHAFIEAEILPLFPRGLICFMELVEIPIEVVLDVFREYVNRSRLSGTDKILCFKLPNLKDTRVFKNTIQKDHQTKICGNKDYSRILVEIKPKWLDYPTSYCRNCVDNLRKGRNIEYCYSNLLKDSTELNKIISSQTREVVPSQFIEMITKYFESKDNVLQKIFTAQRTVQMRTNKSPSNGMTDLQLLMTLRDVTCFIEWDDTMKIIDELKVNIVDVDLKTPDKFDYWRHSEQLLETYPDKTFH
ncbi:Inositol-pentakisphosphate 2-kinase [Maudiozyma exigua]|uniref:Inositol-pentakisphosphate 2-kinase n=1 Tax=Maudiozyma exigua TaxID=34358 RepID=A0A9P6VWV9_MAUEX|nr:Inositol-pentakisphosphate 2-kinase [Kazachstania exigua]